MLMVQGADHRFSGAKHRRDLARAVTNWFSHYFLQKYTEVIDVFVAKGDMVLMLKRSSQVGYYKGAWSTVAGHLEEGNTPLEQAYDELKEEIGLTRNDVRVIAQKRPFLRPDAKLGKIWKVNLILVETKRNPRLISWESTAQAWVSIHEFCRRAGIPNMGNALLRVVKGSALEKRLLNAPARKRS